VVLEAPPVLKGQGLNVAQALAALACEGAADGAELGATEGDALGACDGDMLGATEGADSLGACVGT